MTLAGWTRILCPPRPDALPHESPLVRTCPVCGAKSGEQCRDERGEMAPHEERALG